MTFHIVRDIYRVIAGLDDLGDKLDLETAGTHDAREAAARFSRGNVAVQSGAFLTTSDLERERARMSHHSFPG
jgi:hypothetical protein